MHETGKRPGVGRIPRGWLPSLLWSLLLAVVLIPGSADAHHPTFSDLTGSTFEDDATWLAGVGGTQGCGDGRFCPTDELTRGQLAAMLVRLLELPAAAVDPFLDDGGGLFDAEAAALAAAGITTGCAEEAFCPARTITRAELAVLLVRALELPDAGDPGFSDVAGRWFAPEVAALAAAGITAGCTTGVVPAFCPDDPVTRGQAAAMLHRGLGDVLLPDHDPVAVSGPRHDLTLGTAASSEYEVGPIGPRSSHGNRIYCAVSHVSWDDPVVLPGQPGDAHLHLFVGNTSTDAASSPADLLAAGRSSCEGGSNYRSSLWVPALLDAAGQPVLPEQVFIYYKAFLPGDLPPAYERLQEVPNGLAFLASAETLNAVPEYHLRYGPHDGGREFAVAIDFPSCVATDDGTRTGTPVLDFRDMPGAASGIVNSHVAYPGGPDRNELGCPASHPYRFPTPILNLFWDADLLGAGSRLSSDIMAGAEPMSTLHADYVFGVADEVNQAILRCTVESRSCGFSGGRGQLPERFLGPDGEPVYENSVALREEVDRTPFGVLPAMRTDHH